MHLLYPFLLAAALVFAHDYHVGLTEIHYNKDKQSLETSIRVFTEDLEQVLLEATQVKMHLNTPEQHEKADYYVEQYLRKHVAFFVNGKEKEYVFLGKEYEEDVIWMYVEVPKVRKIKSFSFKNALLTDLFDDQKNIVNTKIMSKKKGAILQKGKLQFSISY